MVKHVKKKTLANSKTGKAKLKTSAKSKSGKSKLWMARLVIAVIWMAVIGGGLVVWFGYDLPTLHKLGTMTRMPGLKILDKDGKVLATRGDVFGKGVELASLPPYVWQSILAIEDRKFYQHWGVDVQGILRAMYSNFKAKRVVQGGSTLTQQLAKNFLFSQNKYSTHDRSIKRKVQELILAIWIEHVFSKEQILTMYMNRVYLGSGVFGFQAAARKYFNKPAQRLDLLEAATLAGLLKAPTSYSPIKDFSKSQQRAKTVLYAMQDAGYVTEKELKNMSYKLKSCADASIISGYFVDWIVSQIPTLIKDCDQDLVIHTTLDSKWQIQSNRETASLLQQASQRNVSQAAVLTMSLDGAVRVMIGGADYRQTQFNRCVQSQRQAGSIYKLFTYLAALVQGYKVDSLVATNAIKIGKWQPSNYSAVPDGEVTLTHAFANSINTSTVRLAQKVGLKRINNLAQSMGIRTKQPNDLSAVLGSGSVSLLDISSAYACVARSGIKVAPYGVKKIVSRAGKVLYQHQPPQEKSIVSPVVATGMKKLLNAVVLNGTGRNANFAREIGGKTGTSQLYRDAWFVGFCYQPDYIAGVWIGNDGMVGMNKVTGGALPAQLWKAVMQKK